MENVMPAPETPCECGHILDEHDPIRKDCTVAGCPCIHFDEAEAS